MTDLESQQYNHEVGIPPQEEPPRRARCSYYGQSYRRTYEQHRISTICSGPDLICHCERDVPANHASLPWNEQLAFFKAHPDQPFDEFYCGCAFGWD